ncbi:hypothetical protein C2845_PM10G06750 [Panicum miliaceum]|uniref:Uncharacterized protein n=1 Tax=Panicum miliaceum TaxID=4540 RepID=A0A3L6PCB0_PANMI|nr:hypothetical protein C2845_PM10G06750 [Panicum miliaceum]
MRSKLIVAVVLAATIMAFVVASSSARPLMAGDGAWGAGETVVSGDHTLRVLRRLYLQQLGAGPSCQTNSPNAGCKPPSSG